MLCPRYNRPSVFNSFNFFKRTKVPARQDASRSGPIEHSTASVSISNPNPLINPPFSRVRPTSSSLPPPFSSTFHVTLHRRAILARWTLLIEQLQYGVNLPLPSPSTLTPKPKRTSIAMVYGQSTMAQKEYPPEPHRGMFWVELIE